ncbi:DUF4381 domain-containing protein [Legionella sp.]|uniref:DUF4381 domain-containing protein n=1 Tax=Legionella sp. TaxID=459 RepID=UPI003C800F3D
MDKTDLLAQLKDIHLPNPVSWWPLAPGWYVLITLVLLLTLYLVCRAYRRYYYALAKKQALILLATYQKNYEEEQDVALTSAHISELLRRVALVYFPRKQVASLHGQAWLQFLNQTSKGIDFNAIHTMLLDTPFKAKDIIDLNPLFNKARLWIKQRRIPCSN